MFSWWPEVKNPPAKAGDTGDMGRSPGGNREPTQYSPGKSCGQRRLADIIVHGVWRVGHSTHACSRRFYIGNFTFQAHGKEERKEIGGRNYKDHFIGEITA